MPVLVSNRCAHLSGGLIRGSLVYAHINRTPLAIKTRVLWHARRQVEYWPTSS